jgi:hypothetical protein
LGKKRVEQVLPGSRMLGGWREVAQTMNTPVSKCKTINKRRKKKKNTFLKRFCTTKETLNRIRRQHTERKKLFCSYFSNRELIIDINSK